MGPDRPSGRDRRIVGRPVGGFPRFSAFWPTVIMIGAVASRVHWKNGFFSRQQAGIRIQPWPSSDCCAHPDRRTRPISVSQSSPSCIVIAPSRPSRSKINHYENSPQERPICRKPSRSRVAAGTAFTPASPTRRLRFPGTETSPPLLCPARSRGLRWPPVVEVGHGSLKFKVASTRCPERSRSILVALNLQQRSTGH